MRVINDLKQKRAGYVKELQDLAVKCASGPLDATEQGKYENLKTAISDIDSKIADLQGMQSFDDGNYSPVNNNPNEPGDEKEAKKRERTAFENFLRYGVVDRTNLRQGNFDNNVAARFGIVNQDRTGFAPVVPDETMNEIFKKARESSLLMKLAREIKMPVSSINIPLGKDDTIAYWRGEKGAYTASAGDLDQKVLKAYNLYVLTKLTNELIEDSSMDVEAYTAENQGLVLGEKIDATFLANTAAVEGVSPKGLFDDMDVLKQAGATLKHKDVVDLLFSLKKKYRANGDIVATNDFIKEVMTMVDDNNRPIYMPSFDVGQPDRVLGIPIHEISELGKVKVDNVDKQAKAVFADWKQIAFGLRRQVTLKRLVELFAGNGQIGLISDTRVDSIVVLKEATRILYV